MLVGPGVAFQGMVLDPVFKLRGGRSLPIPPPWGHLDGFLERSRATVPPQWPIPSLDTSQQLFVWFFLLVATVAFVVGVGIWAVHRDPGRFRARVLFATSLFGLGLVPQALQRVDSAHFGWVSCVPVALEPPRVPRAARGAWSGPEPTPSVVALRSARSDSSSSSLSRSSPRGRSRTSPRRPSASTASPGASSATAAIFYYGRADVQAAATKLLAEVPKIAKPGSRLFVGTTDLRYTPYSDAWFYYLLPEYPPGTYYIEMDPGVANAKDSRLAEDLRSSDIAILSSVWKDWSEPNDSRFAGSDAANKVLAARLLQGRRLRRPLPAVQALPMSDPVVQSRRSFVLACLVGGVLAVTGFVIVLHAAPGGFFRQETFGNFFDAQANAWLHGRWNVPPHTFFVEGFRHGAKTYTYFGPWPAVLRLPILAITGRRRGT